MSCSVGRRHGSDPMLLCLWSRLAAVAPIRHLAWELPCAAGAALKKKKKKKKKTQTPKNPTYLGATGAMSTSSCTKKWQLCWCGCAQQIHQPRGGGSGMQPAPYLEEGLPLNLTDTLLSPMRTLGAAARVRRPQCPPGRALSVACSLGGVCSLGLGVSC